MQREEERELLRLLGQLVLISTEGSDVGTSAARTNDNQEQPNHRQRSTKFDLGITKESSALNSQMWQVESLDGSDEQRDATEAKQQQHQGNCFEMTPPAISHDGAEYRKEIRKQFVCVENGS